jgi:hypothetical protein
MFGLEDGYNYFTGAPASYDLNFVTYWATRPPVYHWRSSNPAVADVEYDSSEFDKARLIIKQNTGLATITLVDTTNYLCVQNGQSSIPPNFAGLYRRTICVSDGSAIIDVNSRGRLAPTVSPAIFDRQVQISGAEGSVLKIFNINGAGVHTQSLVTNDETVRLERLPAGMYIFCIEKKGETTRIKTIKNK